MPRDGSITFGDLIGQLDHLEIACPKCDRLGRYSVRRLALQHGRDGKLTDWIGRMTKDCPRRQSPGLADGCGVRCPDLLNLARQDGQGPDAA
jgi:hypothetical protein